MGDDQEAAEQLGAGAVGAGGSGGLTTGATDTGRLLRRHGVTHVYIGPGEVRDWRANTAWYAARFPRVLAEHGVEVFDVRERLPNTEARVVVAQGGTP